MLNWRSEERKYGIRFRFSLFCEYINLAYVRVPIMFRVNEAE